MRRWHWFLGIGLLVGALWIGTVTVLAQDPTPNEQTIPPDEPTDVYLELAVLDIPHIDPINETFDIDGHMVVQWVDPRQAYNANNVGTDSITYVGDSVNTKMNEVWHPDIQIVNGRGPRTIIKNLMTIDDDGTVTYDERFNATITSPLNVSQFPFDTQTLEVIFASYTYTDDLVVFNESFVDNVTLNFEIPEWHIDKQLSYVSTSTQLDLDEEEDVQFSTAVFEIDIQRLPGYYISRIFLPLILITAISWAVFWMDYEDMSLADRLGVSFTAVLTVVAFNFVTTDSIPHIAYLTFLDSILTMSYIIIALSVVENVWGYVYVKRGQSATAVRLDRFSRIWFPISYALGWLVLSLIYFVF